MENSGDMEQGEIKPELENGENQPLNPFVCGLCDCSYGQFVSFYKHFKKHSKEVDVGQDSFHICEDLSSSERDVCEDQSESLEMQTYNCGMCPASFITVCILHEHLQKHESKGSYTLDIQSRTGYPRSKQYPYVSLGNVTSSFLPTSDSTGSAPGVKAKRGRPSKHGLPVLGNDVDLADSEVRSKRSKPSNDKLPPDVGVRTRRGRPSKHGTIEDGAGKPDQQIKATRGSPTNKQLNKRRETTRPGWKKLVLKKSDTIPEYVEANQHESAGITKNVKKEKQVTIKPEPVETRNEASSTKILNKTQDKSKVYIDNAENDNNETEEFVGMDDFNDSDDGHDNEDFYNDDNDASEEERDANAEHTEDEKPITAPYTCDKVEGRETDPADQSLKVETEVVEGKPAETEEDPTYNFRQKRNSQPQVQVKVKQKFLFCEVCGMKREQYLLVKHVKETHGGVELSKEFMEVLEKLKAIKQSRTKKLKTKSKRKIKNDSKDDADYEPSSDLYQSPIDKPLKEKRVKRVVVKYHGSKKSFAKCKLCCMIIPLPRLKGHENSHRTNPDKFRPENLTKCEVCNRVLFKMVFDTHKCSVMQMNKKEKKKKEGSGTDDEPAEKRPKKNTTLMPCHVCGVLVHRYKLKVHLITHSDARPYTCSKCPSAFKSPKHLKTHLKNVHGERSFQCDQCTSAFTSNHQLKEHYMLHTDERPFTCTICGNQFRRNSALQIHIGRHDAVGRYSCKECGRVFKAKTGLKGHIHDVHRNIRDWICSWPQCAKSFTGGPTLRRHMIIHTGQKRHRCTHCEQAFSQRPELKTHMLKRHNIDKIPTPSLGNPYSSITPSVIKCPATDEDPDQSDNVRTFKTIMFTSAAMSDMDKQALQNQLALQLKNCKPRERKSGSGGQKSASSVQYAKGQSNYTVHNANPEQGIIHGNSESQQVCMDDEMMQRTKHEPFLYSDQSEKGTRAANSTVMVDATSLPLLSNTRQEPGISNINTEGLQETSSLPLFSHTGPQIRAGVFISPIMPETNSLSIYRNVTGELRTNNTCNVIMQGASSLPLFSKPKSDCNTSNPGGLNLLRQHGQCDATTTAVPGTSSLPLHSNITRVLGTDGAAGAGVMQGASSLSMPLVFDGVKAELGPSSMDVQTSLMSGDSVLTTMAAAAISQPASDFVYEHM